MSGNGGYEFSSTTGSGHDQSGTAPGAVTGDSTSKTVTVIGIGAYSKPLGAAFANKTFDYSATISWARNGDLWNDLWRDVVRRAV